MDTMGLSKRRFLQGLGATLGLPVLARAARAGLHGDTRKPPIKNWIWATPDAQKPLDVWRRELALARHSGVHAVAVEIYNGRRALFGSRRLPVEDALLERLLPIARAAGLELHAWMWAMPCLI